MKSSLDTLQRLLGYRFNDPQLLLRALSHRSVGSHNNERLEFLGDAVLGFVIAEELYHLHGRAGEGDLSRQRSALVKGDTLAKVAQTIQLGDYLRLGPGELRSGGHTRTSILADALEALFAAIYLDGGLEAARATIRRLLQQRLHTLSSGGTLKDPKTRLQEFLQAQRLSLPSYEVTQIEGEPHRQNFTVRCQIPDLERTTTASGSSRRKAEQAAALALLEQLQ